MNPKNNEKFDIQASEQFSDDLKALFEPKTTIRPHIDRAVMDQAAQRLRQNGKGRRFVYGAVCAAAAMIVVGVLFLNFNKPLETTPSTALQNDINRDGAVDILDAFRLARQVESGGQIDPKWDTNGDGVVDQKDVDTVAMAAVKLNEGVL